LYHISTPGGGLTFDYKKPVSFSLVKIFNLQDNLLFMDKKAVLNATEKYVKQKLAGEGTGHDFWHICRVRDTAMSIGKHERADLFTVQLAALLHDISDWKFNEGDDEIGPRLARGWLEKMQLDEKIISHVCEIIKGVSFKGAGVPTKMRTIEGLVVQDADRLDALGAIGIARTFAYGGHKGNEIYNPGIRPEKHDSFEQYKRSKGTTINHFYEKLLLLKSLMNTATAKKIAEERHQFMEQFLDRFYKEWEGKA
jgi:uncharacterized protein